MRWKENQVRRTGSGRDRRSRKRSGTGHYGHGYAHTLQKVKNIRRDPRVALSMLSDATIYGDAHVTEGGAFDLL